jgi:NAD(P)-dependent dehydrogenase (short-subunit alcohol dehydrogenase family)
MKGKTALVTGSSEGLGRAILLRLAAEGANVVINYHRNETAAKEVKTAAEAEGVRAIVVQADVSSVPDIERLYDAAVEEFGRIDIVVANAGMEKVNIRSPTSQKRTSTCCGGSTPRDRTSSCARPPGGSPTMAGSSRSRPTRRPFRRWVSPSTEPARSP